MPSRSDTLTVAPATDVARIRSIVRPAVAATGVLALLGLLALVPGIGRLFGWLPVGFDAALLAVGALVAAGALLLLAPRIEALVVASVRGPIDLVADAGTVVRALVSFLAIVVAYAGLTPALRPLFVGLEAAILFDGTFALTGLGFVALIGYRLYRNWELVTDLVTEHLVDNGGGSEEAEAEPPFEYGNV